MSEPFEQAKTLVETLEAEADNAFGNAQRALFTLQNNPDIAMAIEALTWAKEQAETVAYKANLAINILKILPK